MTDTKKYWFPAKRYGWGWGAPIAWQGWAVVAVYALLLAVASLLFAPAGNPITFIAYTTCISGLLVSVCWAKGEPLHWRWPKK